MDHTTFHGRWVMRTARMWATSCTTMSPNPSPGVSLLFYCAVIRCSDTDPNIRELIKIQSMLKIT
jgi:hypothetical protein